MGYVPNAIVGFYDGTPGERFRAGGGSAFPGGRFGDETVCQISYLPSQPKNQPPDHRRLRPDEHRVSGRSRRDIFAHGSGEFRDRADHVRGDVVAAGS